MRTGSGRRSETWASSRLLWNYSIFCQLNSLQLLHHFSSPSSSNVSPGKRGYTFGYIPNTEENEISIQWKHIIEEGNGTFRNKGKQWRELVLYFYQLHFGEFFNSLIVVSEIRESLSFQFSSVENIALESFRSREPRSHSNLFAVSRIIGKKLSKFEEN